MAKRVRIEYGGRGKGSVAGEAARGLLGNFRRFVDDVNAVAEGIVSEAAEIVLARAVENAPEDTGALRESGRVETEHTESGANAWVAFGGDYSVTPTKNAPKGVVTYAAFVHEDMERSYRTGGPKYLERAISETRSQVDQFVFKELSELVAQRRRSRE